MNILITGAGGMIGGALRAALSERGDRVIRLVRDKALAGGDAVFWNPESGEIDADRLAGVEAVIHLAGENIAAGRWTSARKSRIMESRRKGTSLLAETVAGMIGKPGVFISASAVGRYGDRGDEILTEESPAGCGFLAEVCQEWEQSAQAAGAAGVRVATLRFGVVLDSRGGALKKMLPPFRMGLGGPIAGGRQWLSWIALEDAVAAVVHVMERPELSGALNVVSPNPATNAEFTRALARTLRRPAICPIPGFAVKALFGEMGEATVLASCRAEPRRLAESGFHFRYPDLEGALAHAVGAPDMTRPGS